MKSSQQEPNEPKVKFKIWDWAAIYLVSDFGSAGIVTLISGGFGGFWFLGAAACIWWLHMWNVKFEMESGKR